MSIAAPSFFAIPSVVGLTASKFVMTNASNQLVSVTAAGAGVPSLTAANVFSGVTNPITVPWDCWIGPSQIYGINFVTVYSGETPISVHVGIGFSGVPPFCPLTVRNVSDSPAAIGLESLSITTSSKRWWMKNDIEQYGDFAIRTEITARSNVPDLTRFYIDPRGAISLGSTHYPPYWLSLRAGTTSLAPLGMPSGDLLSTPLAGAFEFLTDTFYVTISTGPARKGIVLDNGTRLTSGKIPVATTNGRLIDLTAQAHEADTKIDYADADLDTTSEIRAAINTTNSKINAILAKLETLGLLAAS